MATDSSRTQSQPAPLSPPSPSAATNRLTAGWANALRRNADAQAQASAQARAYGPPGSNGAGFVGGGGGAAASNGNGPPMRGGGSARGGWQQQSSRPASTSTVSTTNTSLRPPSLFSIDSAATSSSMGGGSPASPTTSSSKQYSSSSSTSTAVPPLSYRHSSASSSGPKPSYPQQPRSHLSLPPSSGSGPSGGSGGGRHRDQLNRVYGDSTYDAEFDRSAPIASTSARGGTSASSSSSNAAAGPSKQLYNPESSQSRAQVQHDHRRGEYRAAAGDDSSMGSRRTTRSKRDQGDPADLGGGSRRHHKDKESRESLEGMEELADNASLSKPSSRSSKESKNRRKREEREGRRRGEDGNGVDGTGGSTSGSVARLFDPRRDDPLKFGTGGGANGAGGRGGKSPASIDTRSFASSNISATSGSQVSGAEAPYAAIDEGPVQQRAAEPTQQVQDLKRYLKEILTLENKLVEDHKALMAAQSREDDSSSDEIMIQGGSGRRFDDKYWVDLASEHKKLADACEAFLGIALDPVNLSLHELPKKYKISARLWQTGFLQLLERMRHAALASASAPPNPSDPNAPAASIVEHLIDFIQYAYGVYTQLFDSSTISQYKSAWIEQLGDLARYRMAVAGLALKISTAQARAQQQQQQARPGGAGGGLDRLVDQKRAPPRPIDAASIGEAALNDWDIEEHETWREIARDWYSQGLTDAPGTGRLHHHLAMISKGDELKSLYHYIKSLTTTHPYESARESILPLFEDELQARRTQPDVTKAELFVHLHGMLFTKISLDNFDECYERFIERLAEEGLLLQRAGFTNWSTLGAGAHAPFGDAEWFMVGVINIAALLQYGAEDGVLKRSMSKETGNVGASSIKSRSGTTTIINQKSKATPQAIMLNPSSLKKAEAIEDDEESMSGDATEKPSAEEFVKQLGTAQVEEDPLVFQLAQKLTFGILELALRHPYRTVDNAKVLNPYITLILTFISHTIQQHPSTLRHLERAIPWSRLVNVFNTIPQTIEVRMDVHSKLQQSPLPEDWCLRGMDWAARSLFKKGYWTARVAGGGRRDEMGPPPIGAASPMAFTSELEALKIDLDGLDEFPTEGDAESAPSVLASGRWRRLAVVAAWFVRAVPGLDFDHTAAKPSARFLIAAGLDIKLRRWKQEDKDAAEAERQSRLSAWAGDVEEDEEEETESDEEEEDDDSDSSDVRELKARRRQLKAVLKQARQATRSSRSLIRRISSSTKHQKKKGHLGGRSSLVVFPGYTVLVFDTNILLTSMKLFRDLLEAKKWTLVVPLAVITELDGLKKNPAPLGTAANDAILYLESAIRSFTHHLKVQTSHGNYLKDLSIRSEEIDFAGNGGVDGEGFSADFARSMDDVILRAVAWQKDHFTSRLGLVNPSADRRQVASNTSTVVLISFDRNLRLKARARGLDAADEKDMSLLTISGKEDNG